MKFPGELLAWRQQIPLPVAVVTGSFDLFQPGNLHVLEQARLLAKQVIVVVEPDDIAARHCSPGRPQNKLETRVEMVSFLRHVDAVTRVSLKEAGGFFSALAPYVWVTAKTQKERDPYAAAMASSVDRVVEVEPLEGCFTEDIIAAIAENRTPIKLPALCRPTHTPPRRGASMGDGQPPMTVTVNGCFDILHIGHLRFLAEARALGDSLTVLINSDASVARYKGVTRPVFPEVFRAAALKALDCVSDVVVFQGDNPLDEMRQLRPHIHVKGGSYEPDRVRQERELVESWGGHLVCTGMVEGFSTTGFIRKALGSKGAILV
ncbi:MAG: adenylyltransferase/cytidyltransferase family protein [bacterium]